MASRTQTPRKPCFVETGVCNLIRYEPKGTYYARVRAGASLQRKSLGTTVLSVAKLRLRDFETNIRASAGAEQSALLGKLTFGEAAEIFTTRFNGDPSLKPRSKDYYQQRLVALFKSWPKLKTKDLRSISKSECAQWAAAFGPVGSASAFNNTISVLKRCLDIGIEHGVRFDNPAAGLKRTRTMSKRLTLPEPPQFTEFVQTMRTAGGRASQDCADLVLFLAYGGFRISEAAGILWSDCDFKRNQIKVRGDLETGTKNWSVRLVPMIPEMVTLLNRLRAESPDWKSGDRVMQIRECEKSMTRAAEVVGMRRITHHDLRHLFATRCIESGVDIPTVARWLGHKDGGALAMKAYGHLRDKHSAQMAERVSFGTVVPIP